VPSSGNLTPEPPLSRESPWLAPLAGYSDLSFRLLCRRWGCRAACTEMISAKGLFYSTANTMRLLQTCDRDLPLVVQLYGCDPEIMARAVSTLNRRGFEYFDLNCGCSVKKVVKTGAGAALLKDPGLLLRIVSAMADRAGPGRVGVKMRLGWSSEEHIYLNLAAPLAEAGAGWITLHPRTAVQQFTGKASWQALKNLKQVSPVPVVASGDLFTARDALDCVRQTGVDTVMFARGALMDPAIGMRYQNLLQGRNDLPRDQEFILSLCMEAIETYRRYASSRAVLKLRTLLPRMIRGLPGAKDLRKRIILCREWAQLEEVMTSARENLERE